MFKIEVISLVSIMMETPREPHSVSLKGMCVLSKSQLDRVMIINVSIAVSHRRSSSWICMSKVMEDCRDPLYFNDFLFRSRQKSPHIISILTRHSTWKPTRPTTTSYLIPSYVDHPLMWPHPYLYYSSPCPPLSALPTLERPSLARCVQTMNFQQTRSVR